MAKLSNTTVYGDLSITGDVGVDGAITDTLNLATGNEVALSLNYVTNKLTSGNDTGLVINHTDTLSPGTSLLLDGQLAGVSKFSVDNAGNVIVAGSLATTGPLTITASANSFTETEFGTSTGYFYMGLYGADGTDSGIIFGEGPTSIAANKRAMIGYDADVDTLRFYWYNSTTGAAVNQDRHQFTQSGNYTLDGVVIANGAGTNTFAGNVTVTGTLTVNGGTTTVNTATLSVEDPLIQLANNNLTTDIVDIGMVGLYDTSGVLNLYGGLFRDATDNKWKLFVDSQEDLSTVTTINTAATGYTAGTLVAAFEGDGSAITALSAANISTGTLAVARGGTGLATVATDNILTGNGTGALTSEANLTFSGSLLTVTGSVTSTATVTADTFLCANDATDTFAHRISPYGNAGSQYGMMLWNTSTTVGEWATMIYGPNQANTRISFGKTNTTPTLHAHIDEGAYFDLDDWSLNLTGDLILAAATHIKLPLHNDAATPTIGFGDGDTGFYESADDTINIAIATAGTYHINSTGLGSSTTGGAFITAAAASATVPALRFNGDTDTGIGSSALDQLSLIAGGVEGIRITEAAAVVTIDIAGDTDITGALTATTKSFKIPHPLDSTKTLTYGSLEGPEYGVYHRGTVCGDTIELPLYWKALVDEATITVQLTPVGSFQKLYVKETSADKITIAVAGWFKRQSSIKCDYIVYAERKDIDKLVVES